MIPKIIHYCWFGNQPIPENLQHYILSWHNHMPDWVYMKWSEDNFKIDNAPVYVRQAYSLKKYAFVSDYVRLFALEKYGGLYLDTDVEVLRPFDSLLNDTAFLCFEESLAHLPGTCVIGCEPSCQWVTDMIATYDNAEFIRADGTPNLTTNVQRLGKVMVEHGLKTNGQEQTIKSWNLHIYPHQYFSPITSTRVMRKNTNTYSIHHFEASWHGKKTHRFGNSLFVREIINALVQVKRKIIGKI